MQSEIRVRKKRIYCTAVMFILAAMLTAVLFFGRGAFAASADSNGSFINYTADLDKTVHLDVNGIIGNTREGNQSTFDEYDTGIYKRRTISVSLLTGSSVSSLTSDADIYNYSDEFFTVKLDSMAGYIVINALKPTSLLAGSTNEDSASLPRFALQLRKTDGSVDRISYIAVDIAANRPSLAWMDTSRTDRDLYVSGQLDANSERVLAPGNFGYDPTAQFPLRLEDGDIFEVDLEKYLVNRRLYFTKPDNKEYSSTNETTIDDETKGENPKVGVLRSSNGKYLSFNDISMYYITDETEKTHIGSIINTSSGIKFYDSVAKNRRSFTIDVNINNENIVSGAFWDGDGAYWDLVIPLVHSVTDELVRIHIPVVFIPRSTPVAKANFDIETALNYGSSDVQKKDDPKSISGYGAVHVYPDDICDFYHMQGNNMWFELRDMPKSNDCVNVSAPEADESGRVPYYIVKAVDNGNVDLTFKVRYNIGEGNDGLQDPAEVTVSFTVYGKYTVPFNIKGTKTRYYTIRSSEFTPLRNDGYQILSAKKPDGSADYAYIQCDNGTISIAPNASTADGKIEVTLVNKQGRRIVLTCDLNIDLKAGDLFTGWRLWQKILFWIGIGLALALIILFIVWLFIRSAHRRKLDELETSAPTSAYIIKLNSTIAAAQMQQRMAQQAAYAPPVQPPQPGSMLQLGAGPATTPAPDPNTLALGITPQASTPVYSSAGVTSAPPPATSYAAPPVQDEIYIPISDDELLIRIYEEKFEPRGMLKRTFDKSKDLQQRELEKEKERIREDIRNGMSIEEACKSVKQRESEASISMTSATVPAADSEPVVTVDPLIVLLGFDPTEPIITDVKKEEPQENLTNEENRLKEVEYNNMRLHAELAVITTRIEAINAGVTKTEAELGDANFVAESVANTIRESEQKLDDKNTDLAVERRKAAKEALNKEIAELEAKIKSDKEIANTKKSEIESGNNMLVRLKEVSDDYAGKKEATEALVAASDEELETARKDAARAAELAAKAKHQAELAAKLEILNPMMRTANLLDGEIIEIGEAIEKSAEEKNARKSKIATLQNELITATDPTQINDISSQIKDLNKEISELDRGATANTTAKSDKGIEFKSIFRKANEFIEKEEIEVEEVVAAEDLIIGQIALDKLRAQVEQDKLRAEENIARWQGECDELTANLDSLVVDAAAGVAERITAAESELEEAKLKLAEVEALIAATEDDDEKLNLSMEQMTLSEEVDNLTANLESLKASGVKENLEFRTMGESELELAREELARAKDDFEKATERFHEVNTNVNPLDLITSGSGVISKERKRIEAENLKKLVKEQQNAIEQAKLQAQIAQQEAEKAVADAQRASEESRAEAERLAQEALEKAEAARLEAEQHAQEEIERMRLESEEARRLAEEEKERMRLEAEEQAERARTEAEEAKRLAEEEAERARKEAEEETERVRTEAEEARRLAEEEKERMRLEAEEQAERARTEAEEAKRVAEEEAERARKEAEEEAERVRLEQEEAKRIAEEEAEKSRLAAEEEAKRIAEEEAARKARIDEKVAKRKAEIANLRSELKNVTDEEQGQALHEKFYAIQLALDEDEKTSTELNDLLNKSMDDADHAAELSRYKKLANQKPRRIVKKVTERVNRVPRKKSGARPSGARAGSRPGAARPVARAGARPGAARPNVRPGARPTRPGARPTGTRRPPSGRGPTRK